MLDNGWRNELDLLVGANVLECSDNVKLHIPVGEHHVVETRFSNIVGLKLKGVSLD